MNNTNLGLLILRVALGVLLLLHGLAKLEGGVGPIAGMLEENGLPGFIAYGAYVGEIIAPIMLIVGFRVRIAAILFIFTMLTAIYLVHPTDVAVRTGSGGWGIELQALFLLGSLALFFTGGGKYAVSTNNKWD